MKQSYTDYLNELCGNRMDVLELLISKKYNAFRKFYKTVSKLSSSIAHISYKFSDETSLLIDITIETDVDIDVFINKINAKCDEKYDIDIKISDPIICLTISTRE